MRLLLVSLFLCSCSMVNQSLDPNVVYRRDIKVTVNGQEFDGTGVPAKADKYEMEIESPGKINLLTITSCHRDVTLQPKGSWFSRGDKVKWTYVPMKGLEDGKGCVMEIGTFESGDKGRHAWAMLDFYDGFTGVPAILQCNGETKSVGPVSICQSRAGLMERIIFDRRMKWTTSRDECKVFRTKDEMTYEFQMPNNAECTYYFGDKDGHFHRLTLIGYTNQLVRDL